jgi:hypothetical protein
VTEIDQDILRQALAEDQEEIITVVRESSGGFSIKHIATEPPDRTTKGAFPLHEGETRVNTNSTDQRAKVFPISEAYLSGVILNPPRLRLHKYQPHFLISLLIVQETAKESGAGRPRVWWTLPLTWAEYCIEKHVLTRTGGSWTKVPSAILQSN